MHVDRFLDPLESEKNSIQDILNLMENAPINLNKPRASDASEEAENINRKSDPLQFNENDLIVFRGCDGQKFNVIQLTKAFNAEEATPRTKIMGNILTTIENFVTFQRDTT